MEHFADDIAQAGYSASSRLFRIRWTDPVHYDLLKKIIEFNIKEKLKIRGFGASGRDVEGGRHGRFQRLFIKYRQS